MSKQKRSCILYSERKALADILEKWIKMCGVDCSVFNVLTFLNSVKLMNVDAVAAFLNKRWCNMAKRKRSCILYSERKVLADILEKWIKMCGVDCSVFNVLTFLNSEKLMDADAVAAFINKGGVKPDCEYNPGFKTMGDIIQVRYYPDGVVEVKTIKQNPGRPQNI